MRSPLIYRHPRNSLELTKVLFYLKILYTKVMYNICIRVFLEFFRMPLTLPLSSILYKNVQISLSLSKILDSSYVVRKKNAKKKMIFSCLIST